MVARTLLTRLLIPLWIAITVVVGGYGLLSWRTTRQHYVETMQRDTERSTELIRRATHYGMLLNRKGDVQRIVEQLGSGPDVAAVRVFDKQGRVVFSSDRREIGGSHELEAQPCIACHREAGEPLMTTDIGISEEVLGSSGARVLRHLHSIENLPGCSSSACHAHPPEQRVLGVLDVEMSMAGMTHTLQASARQTAWTSLLLLGVVGLLASAFVTGTILHPVRQLRRGALKIAAGQLDTRIDVKGEHELAQLAHAFNRMAQDLGDARREVDDWSHRLEDKVLQQTEALQHTQQQVVQMDRMASLGKLSATVAHELNNPLNGILTYAKLVQRVLATQTLEPAVKADLGRYLELMQKECVRCGSIVQNLLLFARRRGGEFAPVDLNEIVQRSLMLVRHHLEIKSVRLAARLLPADPTVIGDAGQLQQAVLALLVNAVEAISADSHDGGDLSVMLSEEHDGVLVEVKDSGHGIPPEALPQIFEPFFTTKHESSGVGLGLAVVYGIVKRHHGTIDVSSEPGRGTTFRLWLPRRQPATPDDDGDTATDPATDADPRTTLRHAAGKDDR